LLTFSQSPDFSRTLALSPRFIVPVMVLLFVASLRVRRLDAVTKTSSPSAKPEPIPVGDASDDGELVVDLVSAALPKHLPSAKMNMPAMTQAPHPPLLDLDIRFAICRPHCQATH
jgi:hypothetical protein